MAVGWGSSFSSFRPKQGCSAHLPQEAWSPVITSSSVHFGALPFPWLLYKTYNILILM